MHPLNLRLCLVAAGIEMCSPAGSRADETKLCNDRSAASEQTQHS